MCGIFLCICDQTNAVVCKEILKNETIQHFLSRRGPDHFEKLTYEHRFDDAQVAQFTALSSVLQLRGRFVSSQPATHEPSGSILQWNGQIFAGLEIEPKVSGSESLSIPEQDSSESDTAHLIRALVAASSETGVDDDGDDDNVRKFLHVIGSIRGPWAFTFWDATRRKLWFGRDIVGRRSLCWNVNHRDKILIISSIAHVYDQNSAREPPHHHHHHHHHHLASPSIALNPAELIFEEIPADGLYCLDFAANHSTGEVFASILHHRWSHNISGDPNRTPTRSVPSIPSPITIPFNRSVPSERVDESLRTVTDQTLPQSIPSEIVERFHQLLSAAVERRVGNHHHVCRKCFARYVKQQECIEESLRGEISSDSDDDIRRGAAEISFEASSQQSKTMINGISFRECTHASTAILFSGGIDSTVIALLADRYVPPHLPIDLLNVAFAANAPDRDTGLRAWHELRTLAPARKWNFVSIHISREELESQRSKHIRHLVQPSATVLDDSIGCSVWFATRGTGLLMLEPGDVNSFACSTRARVVLLGMGADEQLGGYTRFRRAFAAGGWREMIAEIAGDVARISARNLGRDDRVTADHGIEARYPFLDEAVISFLNGLPMWHKCNLYLNRGSGEKALLRVLAGARLGLRETARFHKRAIQFGSRIAKLEDSAEKGSHISVRLTAAKQ